MSGINKLSQKLPVLPNISDKSDHYSIPFLSPPPLTVSALAFKYLLPFKCRLGCLFQIGEWVRESSEFIKLGSQQPTTTHFSQAPKVANVDVDQ